jgi:tRNA/rRNA methyltransferase
MSEADVTKIGPVPPVIVLVETQMGENIGAAARAMANFGLKELRLVKPRDGWPNDKARAAASRGDTIIDAVRLFDTLAEAIADLELVYATTARPHDIAKEVEAPAVAAVEMAAAAGRGARCGVVFGREKWGLTSD